MSLRFRVVNYLLFTNGVLVYYLLPYFFGVFSDEHQIGANQLSLLMSADMAGGALAALAARYWLSKWHWHGVFIPATIVAVAANVVSIYATTATEFMVCRVLAGQSKVQSDMNQQQREYFLHQQMKTIQEELGGGVSSGEEIEEMRARAKDKKWDEKVKTHFDKE